MSFFFEDFEVGSRHAAGSRLITDADHEAFCALVGYAIPLFLDNDYARSQGLPGRICPSHLTMSFSTAMSSALLGESVLALLGIEKVRFVVPVLPGDTLRTEIEVLDKRLSSKSDRGIVVLRDNVYNQHGALVFQNDKHAMVRCRRVGAADA